MSNDPMDDNDIDDKDIDDAQNDVIRLVRTSNDETLLDTHGKPCSADGCLVHRAVEAELKMRLDVRVKTTSDLSALLLLVTNLMQTYKEKKQTTELVAMLQIGERLSSILAKLQVSLQQPPDYEPRRTAKPASPPPNPNAN